MTTKPRAITPVTLGAWLIKSSLDAHAVDALMRTRFSSVTGSCVRPTYRVDLIRSGQPVLFWLSGDDAASPAGIYAHGTATGAARPWEADDDRAGPVDGADRSRTLVMPLRLTPVDPPILRSELLEHPVLSRIEVIKMAAGSNPSFLTRGQLAELRAGWPQTRPASRDGLPTTRPWTDPAP